MLLATKTLKKKKKKKKKKKRVPGAQRDKLIIVGLGVSMSLDNWQDNY